MFLFFLGTYEIISYESQLPSGRIFFQYICNHINLNILVLPVLGNDRCIFSKIYITNTQMSEV